MSKNDVLQHFPVERYKRFSYRANLLFTLSLGVFILGLSYISVLPITWALWLSTTFVFNNLLLTPLMSIVNASNNLYHERKKLKSSIILASTLLAALTGGILALLIFSQMPVLMGLLTNFISATRSPLLISIGAIVGSVVAHMSNKLSPALGMVLGIFMISRLPIPIPLTVDVVFISMAAFAFITNIAAKQCMRLYYKIRYGHTNADGYKINLSETDQQEFIDKQASLFKVTSEQFKTLVQACQTKIHKIKNETGLLDELSCPKQTKINSFKDIYHGLMNPKCTKEDAQCVKELLKVSRTTQIKKHTENEKVEDLKLFMLLTSDAELRSNLQTRIHYHQTAMALSVQPGIEDELISPFISPQRK
ncbi:MAG: hypothetical protein QM652_05665 [Legionella sp.]|uniref:hypothetical protein n=1 Tax=Legionella sp. TaxID=459 RepID=UPI0039E5BEBF